MNRNYFTTLMVSEVNEVFSFCKTIKNQRIKKLVQFFFGLILLPLILYRGYVKFTIPYIEIVVTEKCNLNCIGCSNLMPCYKAPAHTDIELVKASIDALLSAAHRVTKMVFIGGEPFLHSDLHKIISHVSTNKKVKNIQITTNGTIIPSYDMLQALKKPHIKVAVSRYGKIKTERVTGVLADNDIRYNVMDSLEWSDYGDMRKRDFTDGILRRSYHECAAAECKTLLKGKLYSCPRSAHGDSLGLIQSETSVDILSARKKRLVSNIKALYSASYIKACDYCTPLWQRESIPCGRQHEDKEKE